MVNNRENYALSAVFGLILVVSIVTMTITAILGWALPQIESKKADIRLENALNQLTAINNVFKDRISQGVGSSSIVKFVADVGNIQISGRSGTRFVIYYSLKNVFIYTFNVSGFGENNFTFTPGPLFDGNNVWINTTDLSTGTTESVSLSGVAKYQQYDVSYLYISLKDAIRIDIHTTTLVDAPVGRIWLFDVGSINYEVSSSSGVRSAIVENGGVISGRSNSYYLIDEPNIYNNDDLLTMRIIQFKPDSETTAGGGKATYRFSMEIDNSFVRENKINISDYFKMQIFGDYADAWINYFMSQQGFNQFNDDTLYLQGDRIFTFTHSICNLDLEVLE